MRVIILEVQGAQGGISNLLTILGIQIRDLSLDEGFPGLSKHRYRRSEVMKFLRAGYGMDHWALKGMI